MEIRPICVPRPLVCRSWKRLQSGERWLLPILELGPRMSTTMAKRMCTGGMRIAMIEKMCKATLSTSHKRLEAHTDHGQGLFLSLFPFLQARLRKHSVQQSIVQVFRGECYWWQWIHPYSAQHYSCLGRLQGLVGRRCRLVHHEIDCWREVGKDDERSRLGFTFHMLCPRWGEPLTFIGPDGKTIMALLSNWLFVHPLIFNQTFVSVHL